MDVVPLVLGLILQDVVVCVSSIGRRPGDQDV